MRMGREGHMRQRDVTTLLGGALFVSLHVHAAAQEGYFGVGHDRWHKDFYLKLNRNDGRGTCCNLMDCRPTQSRMVGDHYEVKVDARRAPSTNVSASGKLVYGRGSRSVIATGMVIK